jgi:hypothetical protein
MQRSYWPRFWTFHITLRTCHVQSHSYIREETNRGKEPHVKNGLARGREMNAESRNCQTSRDYNSSGPLLQGVMCDSAGICVSEADRARNTRKHDNDRAFSGSDSAGLGGRHLVEIQRLPVSRRMQATVSSMPQIGCCHTPGAMHLCLHSG